VCGWVGVGEGGGHFGFLCTSQLIPGILTMCNLSLEILQNTWSYTKTGFLCIFMHWKEWLRGWHLFPNWYNFWWNCFFWEKRYTVVLFYITWEWSLHTIHLCTLLWKFIEPDNIFLCTYSTSPAFIGPDSRTNNYSFNNHNCISCWFAW